MKNTYVYIVIITLLVGGILFTNSSKKNDAKTLGTETVVTQAVKPTEITTGISPTDIPVKESNKSNSKIQIIKATYGSPFGFNPKELTVKVGSPVRLEVYASEDGRGCMSTIMVPGLDDKIQTLVKGQTNVFEFTPTTPGRYPITCAMGVPHGFLIVE